MRSHLQSTNQELNPTWNVGTMENWNNGFWGIDRMGYWENDVYKPLEKQNKSDLTHL